MARAADQHPMRSMDRGMNNASTARPAALVVASLAAALQLNAPAMAQDAGAPASHAQVDRRSETATLDKVMVIGSNIRDAIGGAGCPRCSSSSRSCRRTSVAAPPAAMSGTTGSTAKPATT
ncbi:hypothetical protein G6F63_015493 [Rhizopus arrhizus]|nr:hypothetical protein G6F63_015493 [Rhizopus arrhizus]